MDSHAQYEIRQYANTMAEITKKIVPIAYEAFEDYALNSISLSALEIEALKRIMGGENREKIAGEIFINKREKEEFIKKLGRFS